MAENPYAAGTAGSGQKELCEIIAGPERADSVIC